MPALDLYDRADFYDAFHGTYAADRAYYVKMAKRVGGPVLDVACGTGRLGVELLGAGLDYFGIDASDRMLERFRSKAPAAAARADMRSFRLDRRFKLILIPFNSLQHIHDDEEVLEVLARCREHLEAGGRLAFDVQNPKQGSLEYPSRPLAKFLDEERGLWCELRESAEFDPVGKIRRSRWQYAYENGEKGTFALELRQFFPQEMATFLASSSFRIVFKWGDFSGSAFGEASPRQVFECEVAR